MNACCIFSKLIKLYIYNTYFKILSTFPLSIAVALSLADKMDPYGKRRSTSNPVSKEFHRPKKLGRYGNTPTAVPAYLSDQFRSNAAGNKKSGYASKNGTTHHKVPGAYGQSPVLDTANFMNPNIVEDTTGFQTNYKVPYSKLIRRFKGKYMNSIQQNQLLIEHRSPSLTKNDEYGPGRVYTIVNVPLWNHIQKLKEKPPKTMDDVLEPKEVWNNWTISGVCENEEGQEELQTTNESERDRLLNIITRGEINLYATFGNNVKSGTPLYLILSKEKFRGENNALAEDIADGTQSGPANRRELSGRGPNSKLTNKPYQLRFWADYRYDRPPLSELIFEDEFGVRRLGEAIYIGRARDSSYNENIRSFDGIHHNINSILKQQTVWAFVDPQ